MDQLALSSVDPNASDIRPHLLSTDIQMNKISSPDSCDDPIDIIALDEPAEDIEVITSPKKVQYKFIDLFFFFVQFLTLCYSKIFP